MSYCNLLGFSFEDLFGESPIITVLLVIANPFSICRIVCLFVIFWTIGPDTEKEVHMAKVKEPKDQKGFGNFGLVPEP